MTHSDTLSQNIKKAISENINPNEKTVFYCGGYGDFDNLCAKLCRSEKENFGNCELVFITPYITESQQKKMKYMVDTRLYDATLYPPLENIPPKFAIIKRNQWMIDRADLVIACVGHTYGGAYTSLKYAVKKRKNIINLFE